MNAQQQQLAQQQQQQQWAQQQQQQQQQPQQQAAWGQQQQGQQQWGQQAAGGAQNKDCTIVVTGCTHATVGAIVRGSFQLVGENHTKPTYKKDGQVNGLDVMMYYWDERDGAGFCGWWFGPKVGGDQVWAYHPDKAAGMPPQTGWKVPYDGPVDASFVLQYKPKGQAQPQQQAWGQQAQQPQQQQAWGQQQQQGQAQQQQAWGQQQQQAGNPQQQAQLQQQRQQLEALKQQQMQQQQAQKQQLMQQQQQQQQKRQQEQQMKMQQMKQQQEQLVAKRAEEEQKKKEMLAAKRLEQQAVLNIRRVMQSFRATSEEKYDENKAKLDEVVAEEIEKCGSAKEQTTAELEQAVTATKARLAQLAELKKKEEEKKEAENQRRIDLRKKAEELLAELEKQVEKAETAVKSVTEEAEPILSDKDMKIPEVDACAGAVQEAAKEAHQAAEACSQYATKESPHIKNTPPIQGEEKPASCAQDLNKLTARIAEVKKTITATMQKVTASKIARVKKASAQAVLEKGYVSFKKYDGDKDGKLSRKEIQAYSKGVFSFTVPADTLDLICAKLVQDGSKGVEKADFHKLNTFIGVAREAAIDAKKKAAREAREKEVAAAKEKLQAKITKVSEQITEATEATSKAETQVKTLSLPENKAQNSVIMAALADEVDAALEKAKESHTSAKEAVAGLSADTEPELKGFLAAEIKRLEGLLKPVESRNSKGEAASKTFRGQASKKDAVELEKLRKDALAMIFHHQGAKKLTSEEVFAEFDKKKAGKVNESSFVSFFKTCEKKTVDDKELSIAEDDAGRLFNFLDTEDAGSLSKDEFLTFIRKFMKVVKASVLTEEISLKSTSVRRLEEGEVLDVLTGPTKEGEEEEIYRLKVKAMSDDVEGWVTPVGNQGTVFLQDGGDKFKVVKETILTGSFVIGEDTKTKDRKLKVGETVDVRDWAKKEEASGLMRMKVRLCSDGQVGFVTSVGNTGIVFLEVI